MTNIKTKIPWILKKTVNSYDPNLAKVFLPWALRNPRYLKSFIRLRKSYKISEQFRKTELRNGIKVPPFMILSITSRCNLSCTGCYASTAGNIYSPNKIQLSWDQWYNIILEATKVGVFSFIIAGGEPFLFPNLLELCERFKNNFFLILTNGINLNENEFNKLKSLGNLGIIVSLEGNEALTDSRRGSGVFKKAVRTLEKLKQNGVLSGISVTITRNNYQYWMHYNNIEQLINKGIKIGVFIEYIPLSPDNNNNNDHGLILKLDERARFRKFMLNLRETGPIYIIHSPSDEDYFGGCVSAGRGFAHITPRGDLTPCPVSNIATHNLIKDSLRDGLKSPLFTMIRNNEHLLETEGFPCALFAHPKEVQELANAVGAYRTDIK